MDDAVATSCAQIATSYVHIGASYAWGAHSYAQLHTARRPNAPPTEGSPYFGRWRHAGPDREMVSDHDGGARGTPAKASVVPVRYYRCLPIPSSGGPARTTQALEMRAYSAHYLRVQCPFSKDPNGGLLERFPSLAPTVPHKALWARTGHNVSDGEPEMAILTGHFSRSSACNPAQWQAIDCTFTKTKGG